MRHRHVVVLFAVVIALLGSACKEPTPEPPARRGVDVESGVLRFVPDLPAAQRSTLSSEIGTFLDTLYSDAFILPRTEGSTPVPTGFDPVERLVPLFAPAARPALRAHKDAFTLGPHLDLLTGEVTYTGGVTTQGANTQALLNVTFSGSGTRIDEATPVVLLSQTGTVLLRRAASGPGGASEWFVREFSLDLRTKPAPTPTPT